MIDSESEQVPAHAELTGHRVDTGHVVTITIHVANVASLN